jgi:PhnB protein
MPQLNAYLGFNGNCAEALHFYERVLGAKIQMMMTYGQMPMAEKMPPGTENLIGHAQVVIGEDVLMAGDCMDSCQPYEGIKGVSMTLTYPTANEAKSAFDALSDGGKVTMPLEKTFWAEAFGMTTDRFGTPWIVNGGMTDMKSSPN